jgi:cobalt/nickel transport system ATP-binding protein
MAFLELQNLCVRYPDGTKALNGIDLSINAGESIALIGANGAGKTSLLLALVGILPLEAGSICLDDLTINPAVQNQKLLYKETVLELRRRIGLVFQNPDDQLFMPTIYADVIFGLRNNGLSEEAAAACANETLARLNIAHLAARSPLKLSGGEKRQAALATVLAMHPAVMLFDEPTAFLDPQARRTLIDTLNTLPHTKIIATHNLSFAEETCTRTVILEAGALV